MAAVHEVKIRVRVRGLWRVVLLGWAIRLFRLKAAHVEITHDVEGGAS